MSRPDALNVLRADPPIAETPDHALTADVTPSASVYIRSNFPTPVLGEDHRVRVGGAVSTTFDFGLPELRTLERRTIVMTMECAGNDRLGMTPIPEGEPWNHGAVSTVEWTGVSLGTLLDRAGVRDDAVEILAVGADHGLREEFDRSVRFARSLPLSVAAHDDTIIAFEMNGEPLSPVHGAPFRLVVPRWYGMASVKWLEAIEAIVEPFNGHFQRARYVYEEGNSVTPVTTMRVKSFITAPREGDEVVAGAVTVSGWAWSGDGYIRSVDVRVGDGDWTPAHIEPLSHEYAWQRWSLELMLPERGTMNAEHTTIRIASRATDSSGATQPEAIAWNRLGYGNNAIRSVTVKVR